MAQTGGGKVSDDKKKQELVKAEDGSVVKAEIPVAEVVKVVEAEPQGPGDITRIVEDYGDKVLVTAQHPAHMQVCNEALSEWCDKKIALQEHEAEELEENYKIAKKNKWRTATLRKHANLAKKRVDYYKKIKGALDEGYCIVPNFPLDIFAVRTTKKKPRRKDGNWQSQDRSVDTETNKQGDGKWVDRHPLQTYLEYKRKNKRTGEMETQQQHYAFAHDAVGFPIAMAKPQIMKATGKAMAQKIFDDVGILPGQRTAKYKDPVIAGRIKDPRSTKYNQRFLTFMIAWHLDTSTL